MTTPSEKLLLKSIKWRTSAGWIMVAIILWRYLVYPVANTISVAMGNEPYLPLPPIEWQDVLAIIGLPVGGSFADKLTGDE